MSVRMDDSSMRGLRHWDESPFPWLAVVRMDDSSMRGLRLPLPDGPSRQGVRGPNGRFLDEGIETTHEGFYGAHGCWCPNGRFLDEGIETATAAVAPAQAATRVRMDDSSMRGLRHRGRHKRASIRSSEWTIPR